MQSRSRMGAIQGLAAKTRAPKMENRARAVLLALLSVQTISRSPNFLENVSLSRNQAIKLMISSRKPTCSFFLGCLAQPKQNKKSLQFPLRETEEQKEVYWSSGLGLWEFGWYRHHNSCCILYATVKLQQHA